MSTKRIIDQRDGIFFVTFSCFQWVSLIEITGSYDLVYNWFDLLIAKGNQIAGYVIMPNHVHAMIGLKNSNQTINTIMSNGKRFMAYGIIKRLKEMNKKEILEKLNVKVTNRESSKGQIHRVFEHGFDVKVCESIWFIEQKLNYMHLNPCSKKWRLVDNPINYDHSSMRFYEAFHPNIKSKLTPYTAMFEE
jgi:REP element-mobilizing transposase RayT